jgi:anhydro-N-acetylmuramic acid kinase
MTESGDLTAIGLMSGTSMDGIDAAILTGDGEQVRWLGPTKYQPYSRMQVTRIQMVIAQALKKGRGFVESTEYQSARRDFTLAHANAVNRMLAEHDLSPAGIDLLGFHGQTILHRPDEGWTWQMGDGQLLANETGIAVVDDFRSADVAAGGQGAPFAPLYHRSLIAGASTKQVDYPIAILNIGGISNVTWMDDQGMILGFDTGPGNAQLNDWIKRFYGKPYDEGGRKAALGTVDADIVREVMESPYFSAPYPKSLDRADFDLGAVEGLDPADGAATLSAITAEGIISGLEQLPEFPKTILVCGGGRKNSHIMNMISDKANLTVKSVDALDWRGDYLEAECFAHLAIRSAKGLSLSLPSITGAREEVTGGVFHRPE